MEGSCVERYVLSGRIEGVDPSTMTVVVNGTVVAGTIRTPRAVYRIRSDGGGVHVVSQIDESRLPPGAEPLRPPPADVARTADAVDIPRNTESAIDVAVFHTPAARQAEGGSAGIQAVIDLMVAETNRAYDFNCETPLRFSNPGQTYAGDPLGIPGDLASGSLTGPSDAVRALNDARGTVESFQSDAHADSPDLVLGLTTVNDSGTAPGRMLTLSARVVNHGAAPAPGGSTRGTIALCSPRRHRSRST